MTGPEGSGPDFNSAPPVPPVTHDSYQEVRVQRGELREWAAEVEVVMRTPIEAPGLWTSAGIGVVISALFFGVGLLASTGKNAPSPNPYVVSAAAGLFVIGVLIIAFTRHVNRDAKRLNVGRGDLLAQKIRAADTRTALLGEGDD